MSPEKPNVITLDLEALEVFQSVASASEHVDLIILYILSRYKPHINNKSSFIDCSLKAALSISNFREKYHFKKLEMNRRVDRCLNVT